MRRVNYDKQIVANLIDITVTGKVGPGTHLCGHSLGRPSKPFEPDRQAFGPIPFPESNWRDQAGRSLFPPIERTSLQLPTKTGHFKAAFQCFSRESSEFMEQAMGIEPCASPKRRTPAK